MSLLDPKIYNPFTDESPTNFIQGISPPNRDQDELEENIPITASLQTLSKNFNFHGDEVEEKALIIEEMEVANVFSQFTKRQSTKFQSFVNWVESRKPFAPGKIYDGIKKFKFFTHAEYEPLFSLPEKISCMAISPSNQHLAIVCNFSKINIVDLNEKQSVGVLGLNENLTEIYCLVMSDFFLFSAGWDKLIRKWNIGTLEFDQALVGHEAPVLCMILTPDGSNLISSGEDRTIIVWDMIFCKIIKQFAAHNSPVSALEVSLNGKQLISASWDKTIKVWRTSDYQLEFVLKGHRDLIRAISLTPSGRFLASGGRDKTIKVWDLNTKAEIISFQDHKRTIVSLKFASYGDYLVSVGADNKIKIWNMKKNKMKKSIGVRSEITSLLTTSDGRHFITGGFDKTVKLWNIEKESEMHLMEGNKDFIEFLAVYPDNARGMTGVRDGTIKIWNILKGTLVDSMFIDEGGISALAISRDGGFFATGNDLGYLTIWDAKENKKIKCEKVHVGPIVQIKFRLINTSIYSATEYTIKITNYNLESKCDLSETHPGKIFQMEMGLYTNIFITTARGSSLIYLWGSEDLRKEGILSGHTAEITSMKSLVFSKKMVSAALDLTIKVWNLQSKSMEISINTFLQTVALELSHDNFTIVASHSDGTLRLWDAENGEQIGRTPTFTSNIRKICLLYDGSTVLTVGGNVNGLKKMVLSRIKAKVILNHHSKAVNSLAINKERNLLAAGSDDGTISILEIDTMNVKKTLKQHSKEVKNVIFAGETLASIGEDRILRVYDLNEGKSYILSDGVYINDFVFHMSENTIITSCFDSKFRVFSLDDKRIRGQNDCSEQIFRLISNNKADFLYGVDFDGNVLEFDTETLKRQRKIGSDCVGVMTISENDSMLFCGCSTSGHIMIRVYRLEDLTLLETLYGHSQDVTALIINSKSNKLFSASHDSNIMIWDAENFKKIGQLEGHACTVRGLVLDFSEESLFSCSDDKTIRSWNLKDSRKLPFLEGHSHKILRMAVSSNNEFLVTGDEADCIFVWDLMLNALRFSLKNSQNSSIVGVEITSDNKQIVACNDKGKTTVWDAKEGKIIKEFEEDDGETVSKFFLSKEHQQNSILAYSDYTIRTLDMEKLIITKRFEGHKGSISDIVLTKNSLNMISTADDGKIILWDFEKKVIIQTLDEEATVLALDQNDTFLISGQGNQIKIWTLRNLQLIKTLDEISSLGTITGIKISPDNQRLIASLCFDTEDEEEGPSIKMWDLNKFEPLPFFKEEKSSSCEAFVISLDQKKIYIAQSKTVRVYNYLKCDFNSTLTSGAFNRITAETMSPKKNFIIIADTDRRIIVWDLKMRQKFTEFIGHKKIISHLLATSNNLLISASSDMTIKIWSIDEKRELHTLYGHMSAINAIALSKNEELLLSTSAESGIILWDLKTLTQIKKFRTEENFIYALVFDSDCNSFYSAGDQQILWRWNLKNESEPPKLILIFSIPISKIYFSPDWRIMLVFSLADPIMQIWETENFTMINEIPVKAEGSHPCFLSNFDNRLILCDDRLIDCFTGSEIFHFSPKENISSYFYDFKNNKYYYISDSLKLCQFNSDWFANYLFEYLIYDSLLTLKNDVNVVCNLKTSVFPYFFTHMHLIAIFEKSEDFTLAKIQEKYKEMSGINLIRLFYSVDIFHHTPLDILIQKKNTSLIIKYFQMLFEVMKNADLTDFDSMARFFHYSFRQDYNIVKLLCDLLPLIGEDLSVIADVLDYAFIRFDSSIYNNDLIFDELNEPIMIETQSMYVNKNFVEKKLNQLFPKKNYNKEMKDEGGVEIFLKKPDDQNDNKLNFEENKSIVKAKILVLPGIFDFNFEETKLFYDLLSQKNSNNNIFTHRIVCMLVNFIWDNHSRFYYMIEIYVFLFFFVLFNINFVVLLQLRESNDFQDSHLSLASGVIDILLFVYSIFTLVNEMRQLHLDFENYFKSVWNYIDILIIPLLILSSIMDFLLNFMDSPPTYLSYIKLLFAICMTVFWFRLLSFSRGFKETSNMIRLIFSVISGVKFFVLFMILFMLNFSSSLYLLRDISNSTDETFWNTFLDFYSSAVGDTSGIEDYDSIFPLQKFYMILSTFLFAIISVNLLVSIIGDKHNENKENEEKTRIYELLNIIVDTDISLVASIVKLIRGKQQFGKFLIQLFNEKHEDFSESDYEKIVGKMDSVQGVFEEQAKKIDEKIEMVRKSNESSLEKIEDKIGLLLRQNEQQKNVLEQYLNQIKIKFEDK